MIRQILTWLYKFSAFAPSSDRWKCRTTTRSRIIVASFFNNIKLGTRFHTKKMKRKLRRIGILALPTTSRMYVCVRTCHIWSYKRSITRITHVWHLGQERNLLFYCFYSTFCFCCLPSSFFYLSNKNATCAYVCVSVCLGMWIVKHSSFILQSSPAVNAPRHDDNCRALPTAPNTFNTKCTNVWQRSLGAFASHIIHNSTNLTSE